MERENLMAPWIIGYSMILVSLFTVCTAILGFSTTVWGFAFVFAGCTGASLILWWREERQWNDSLQGQEAVLVSVSSFPQSVMAETQIRSESSQQTQDWLPLEDDDFDLLETYTKDLTERVEAVYPLVDREHVHKIVWAVMIELFCKRMATPAHDTPASVIAAKIARAA